MTEEEARELLPMYADGLLEAARAGELEAVVARVPALKKDLDEMREENALLAEALSPLRPSRSARMRLADAMFDVHRRAEHVANSMPERGWRIFRLGYAFGAVILAILASRNAAVLQPQENTLALYTMLGIFCIGLVFVTGGSLLARLEARVVAAVSKGYSEPSRLEVLTIEIFGMLSIVAAVTLYFFLVGR